MLIENVGASNCADAVAIWRDAASWLRSIGRELWDPEEFSNAHAQAFAQRGELVLGRDGDEFVACMTLQSHDPLFWPEFNDFALYLHKLAVRRSHAGRGWSTAMIDWAWNEAHRQGASALRLDCAPRSELIGLYETHGFLRVDPRPVHLAGFDVVRFQRNVR